MLRRHQLGDSPGNRDQKGWLRIKKIQLIVANNPTWQDLSLEWGKPTTPFNESKLRTPETF